MENKKQIRNFQLVTSIASTIAVIAYFIGIFNFKFDFFLGEISGGLFKIIHSLSEMAEYAGISLNELFSQAFSQVDADIMGVLTVTFIATLVIPFLLNSASAIIGFANFAKNRESKSSLIITLIASIYTVIVAILFAAAVSAIKSELGAVSNAISFGGGYFIQIIAVLVAIVFAVILLVKCDWNKQLPIAETDVGLVGVCGMWTDAEFFNNSGRPIVIGRDASQCDVVITENAENVSRKHCTVNFDYKNNVYVVTDHSSNGTHLDNGKKLVSELPTPVECGTVIIIGDEKNAFRLN